MAKKCPPGKYYCFTDKKCKKIPRGYHIGARGYLARGDNRSDSGNGNENGNGSSNGNGNGGNGSGNGNGGSGGNGGGNGGGGMGESIIYEKSNPRIPRKKGQPAKSKKHSDLYTDEDPKGTIHGLGFKDVAKAKASVSKIRNSSRSHAHKIQAAVAMEQRAREMGKTSEAAVYRKYINAMKKKTKRMNEAVSAAQQAAIAIDMKKKGKKPKNMKEGMYNHTDVGLITNAVVELEDGLKTLKTITYDSVDQLMQGIAKRNDISPTLLHNQFKAKHLTIPDDWAIRYRMNKMKGIEEAKKMTKKQIKKRDEIADAISTREMNKRYGDKNVKYAIATKLAMKEGIVDTIKGLVSKPKPTEYKRMYHGTSSDRAQNIMNKGLKGSGTTVTKTPGVVNTQGSLLKRDAFVTDDPKIADSYAKEKAAMDGGKPSVVAIKVPKKNLKKGANPGEFTTRVRGTQPVATGVKPIETRKGQVMQDDYKYNVSEEGLRDWFGKSSGTTKSGRKVRGWVQVGGKYDGKPCARQPGQKSTPKCVSSSKRRSMSKSERDSAARRKRAADPNQPQKSGAAKPTNVSTDPKRKMKENYFNRDKVVEGYKGTADLSKSHPEALKKVEDKIAKHFGKPKKKDTKESFVNEAKDKKGKGSGSKDACYHKVKSRYSVWPSAYASGALVKCRKVGAANWGNKTKKEGFSPMQVAALEAAGMIEIKEGKKCWKGYKKAGTQKLFGKTYNRCVKAGDELNHDGQSLQEKSLEDFEIESGVKAVKPKKEVELPKTSEKKNTFQSGNPVGKENVKKGMARNAEVTTVTRSQNKKMKNVTPMGDLIKGRLGMEEYAPVTEGVMALMKKKGEKKKSKLSVSPYVRERDAGKEAKKKMLKKDQETVNFLEPAYESKTRLVKNGHTYKVVLTWRGKTYMVQMFVPSVSRPTRQQVEKEVQKIYPDAKLMSFLPRDLEPGEPTVMMGEEKRDEYGDIVGGPKISKKQKAKNLAKNEKDEKITRSEEYISELSPATLGSYVKKAKDSLVNYERERAPLNYIKHNKMMNRDVGIDRASDKLVKKAETRKPENKKNVIRGASPDSTQSFSQEEYVVEDDMKGMSVKSGHKRPTKAGAGMTKKGVEAYRRRNPGSKLKTAVTTKPSKLKKGSKAAKRRKSYCARSAGQMKKFPKAAKDPNSRLRQARRRWNC